MSKMTDEPADPAAAARAGYRDTWSGPTPTGYRLKDGEE